jgi:hypothetical protein
MEGLQKHSGFTSKSAAYFKNGGAPRPLNYLMHVPPPYLWYVMIHEYTHTLIEEVSGQAYKSIKWIDDGLAEFLPSVVLAQTRYKESELNRARATRLRVQRALQSNKFFNLPDFATEDQWHQIYASESRGLIYAESFMLVSYLVEKYGLAKCFAVLKQMNAGLSREKAIQKVLHRTVVQLNEDFKSSLSQ